MSFREVSSGQNFPKLEEEILKFWAENKIFEKSLEKNDLENKFVFYEGPPTANGKPGIHHVLARSFKDLIPRYKTMQGFRVKRRAGWDCHGLPVEIEVEKSLGISGKKEIEKYGVAKFNEKCRESVWTYKEDWEKLTKRIGFWIDLENPYITYENSYIENVWGIIKKIWDKDLIYSGFKVVPHCPRCETTLSSHEVAQGYKNIEEESIYVKFKLKEKDKFLLVWTTTPWTLPGNIALAVGENIEYAEAKYNNEIVIIAKDLISKLDGAEIIKEYKGSELEGWEYEPLFDSHEFISGGEGKNFKVYAADFVTTSEGTGIVHIAPAFGEDDMNLQNKIGFAVPLTTSIDGKMLTSIAKDKFVKDADSDIKQDLEKRGLLTKKENIKHDYPYCWRCDSILIYYAKSTWFIAMSKLRDELIKNNKEINWVPAYIKDGRFGEWLAEVKDWAISRERYWGTPLPIWECECNEKKVIGSIAELKENAISSIDTKDLHKPYIDEIKLKCPKCGGPMQRTPEVMDVWLDSGSMPFSSNEFPDNYPADYISEAIDQTRGWFYTMLAISTLLGQGTSYKNVICLAHVLDEKGKKMSKSKGNVIDPWTIVGKYGSDSLRWYFYIVNGPGDPKRLGERSIEITLRQFIMLLWNVYSFFVTYANIDGWTPEKKVESKNILDRWIIQKCNKLNSDVTKNLDNFDIQTPARDIQSVVNELSTWYLRRSRKRRDSEFYSTLYNVLFDLAKLSAPFIPFTTEAIYQNLKTDQDPESVHLCNWGKIKEVKDDLILEMDKVRKLTELAHGIRATEKIKLRQPLAFAFIKNDLSDELIDILKNEINVKEIIVDKNIKSDIELDTKLTTVLLDEGIKNDLVRMIQGLRKENKLNPTDVVTLFYKINDQNLIKIIDKYSNEIKKETNLNELISGEIDNMSSQEIAGEEIQLGIK